VWQRLRDEARCAAARSRLLQPTSAAGAMTRAPRSPCNTKRLRDGHTEFVRLPDHHGCVPNHARRRPHRRLRRKRSPTFHVPASPAPAARADFNGDGKADILWRNSSLAENYVWADDGTTITGEGYLARPT